MLAPVSLPKVAVLGLSLPFYAEQLPEFIVTQRRQLETFTMEIRRYATVAVTTFCSQPGHVAEAIEAATRADVAALVVIPLSYTASLMSVPQLAASKLPLVVWITQEAERIDGDYDFTSLLHNHTAQGGQDVTSVLLRRGSRFGVEVGHFRDKAALQRLDEWLRAARAQQIARSMRVGLLGAPFEGMGDFLTDREQLDSQWGPQVVEIEIGEFVRLMEEAPDDAIAAMRHDDLARFEIDKSLVAATHESSLRGEWALRRLVEREDLAAFTMNFVDLMRDGRSRCLPLFGVNKLMAEGLGYAGEGDFATAALVAQLRQLSRQSNFTEIYTIDFPRRCLMMTHMQECNPDLARTDRRVRLLRKEFWAAGIDDYAGMHFSLEPGPVTLICLHDTADGKLSYLAYETTILDHTPFPRFDVPHWLVQLDEPAEEFLKRYSEKGGTHHLASMPGHQASALAKLAHLQGMGFERV